MISLQETLLRMGIALVLGAVVGLEREVGERAAGMRTNALVALGCALFTIISAYGFLNLLSIPRVQVDPTRIASYIVSGIGFIGAGTIFLSRETQKVRGLTTAAAIWLVAAVGIACGAGLLLEAVASTILALIVLIVLRTVERRLMPHHKLSDIQRLQIEVTSVAGQLLSQVYDTCTRLHITVEKLEVRTEQEVDTVEVVCRVPDAVTFTQVVGELHGLPAVRAVHADLQSADMKNATSKGTVKKTT